MMFSWLRKPRAAAVAENERWVVLDVETSGFDMQNDQLLSIGAVAMHADGRIVPADSLEVVLRQREASSKDNIVIHGIGAQAQRGGVEPAQAMHAFLEFVGASPLIAFHAPFDRSFITRAVKTHAGRSLDNHWLDLAEIAPAIDPQAHLKALDEWLLRYKIEVSARHSAAADAYATALLAARLLPGAHKLGARSFAELQKLAKQARWLAGQS